MRLMDSVIPYFLGDCCRIFAQETCDILKGQATIKSILDINPVVENKVFLVSGNQMTHILSFPCCQKVSLR